MANAPTVGSLQHQVDVGGNLRLVSNWHPRVTRCLPYDGPRSIWPFTCARTVGRMIFHRNSAQDDREGGGGTRPCTAALFLTLSDVVEPQKDRRRMCPEGQVNPVLSCHFRRASALRPSTADEGSVTPFHGVRRAEVIGERQTAPHQRQCCRRVLSRALMPCMAPGASDEGTPMSSSQILSANA